MRLQAEPAPHHAKGLDNLQNHRCQATIVQKTALVARYRQACLAVPAPSTHFTYLVAVVRCTGMSQVGGPRWLGNISPQ
jgi:hypothetical protein